MLKYEWLSRVCVFKWGEQHLQLGLFKLQLRHYCLQLFWTISAGSSVILADATVQGGALLFPEKYPFNSLLSAGNNKIIKIFFFFFFFLSSK